MNYLYFCIAFLFCTVCVCAGFLFCSRVIFIQKTEKIDPLNIIKTPKKLTALKAIKREEALNALLQNG